MKTLWSFQFALNSLRCFACPLLNSVKLLVSLRTLCSYQLPSKALCRSRSFESYMKLSVFFKQSMKLPVVFKGFIKLPVSFIDSTELSAPFKNSAMKLLCPLKSMILMCPLNSLWSFPCPLWTLWSFLCPLWTLWSFQLPSKALCSSWFFEGYLKLSVSFKHSTKLPVVSKGL